jgi:hypothetical protein
VQLSPSLDAGLMRKRGAPPYLYRIMPFKHVVDLLENREMYFASPNAWDDPYERILQHRGAAHTFAQCWCKRAVSDAMWRIYSPDRTAVRIRTSRAKLEVIGSQVQASYQGFFRVGDVAYESAKSLDAELESIYSELKQRFTMKRALDALFFKRDAFDFEAEVRAVVYIKPQAGAQKAASFRFRVDPYILVESILFDPRADETYVKVATHYLRMALHFEGSVSRSALYRAAEVRTLDEVSQVDPSK